MIDKSHFMAYLVRTPTVMSKLIFPGYVWDMPGKEKKLFLSFDDGPHPEATPFALDILKAFNARATFFCIGKNVALYPDLYKRIIMEGHQVGNHTMNHMNGWKSSDADYLNDVGAAMKYIDSKLFRPPYGRIGAFQAKQLKEVLQFKIIMWTVLSGDFDRSITGDQCWMNVKKKSREGSIIVYHDSEKAFERMRPALKATLDHFSSAGYSFDKII